MSLNDPINRTAIESFFPDLKNDNYWKVTSPEDPTYNCIAFAAIRTDIWYWPTPNLDGVDWPYNLPYNQNPETFKELFKNLGYSECGSSEFENGFQKIAIYAKNNLCTHACRQTSKGIWKTKFGESFDIEHSDPCSTQNAEYGNVICFMKRKFN